MQMITCLCLIHKAASIPGKPAAGRLRKIKENKSERRYDSDTRLKDKYLAKNRARCVYVQKIYKINR